MTLDHLAPAVPAVTDSVAQRLRQRIFHPCSRAADASASERALPPPQPAPITKSIKAAISFQSRIAEFLLISRLRTRQQSAPSLDVLQRAEHIVFITCQNWFAPPEPRKQHRHTQL
jgi:hypothetical protein